MAHVILHSPISNKILQICLQKSST